MQMDARYPSLGGETIESSKLTHSTAFRGLVRRMAREGLTTIVGVVVARPFQVVMVRQMAQFIGGETKYGNCLQAIRTIINEEGVTGLFAGLIPQLLASLGIMVTIQTSIFVFERAYLQFVMVSINCHVSLLIANLFSHMWSWTWWRK